jgi:1-deoxy-D-xylulose-5-phosphate reductoisomerase
VRRKVAILGSTGSIGRSTLEVVAHHQDRFEVVGLAAGGQVERLAEQVRAFRPGAVALADAAAARRLQDELDGPVPEILVGPEGAAKVAVDTEADVVVAGIVGAAGLVPTLAAVESGRVVALANKETLVVAGELIMRRAAECGAALLPVDSEHNAIHQCLRSGERSEVRRLLLTASGGPFRGRTREQLERVTVEQALDHPTWNMGRKITIDSATLMNKGLEVIEASWLFGFSHDAIDVVVHPQSVVHSLVEYRDGSLIAQLGHADMRHPIQYALSWPDRLDGVSQEALDLCEIGQLSFERPERRVFRCLDLAFAALSRGGDAPARLNAANEIAVEAFLEGRIGFLDIAAVIEDTLERSDLEPASTLEDLLTADRDARRIARELTGQESRTG